MTFEIPSPLQNLIFSKNQIEPTSKMQISTWVCKILIIFLVCGFSQAQICSEGDRAALIGFKARILKDTTGALSSWRGKDCCGGGWEGIQCDLTGRVTQIMLQRPADKDSGVYMKGILSPTLGDLKFLEILVISGMKRLSGTIPSSFSGLKRLTQLVLEDNSIEGTIPSSLSQLPLLQTLSLSGNHLTGPIPPTFQNLSKLAQLTLARNSLSGTLALGKLAHLQYLDVNNNMLSGLIPVALGQLSELVFLDLSNNRLAGPIPNSFSNLQKLQDLSLNNNLLTGQLPPWIGQLKSLATLSLGYNQLIGQIPESISQLQNLWNLSLSRNSFSDPLPNEALSKGLPSLLSIDLSYNKFNLGTIPKWITSRQLSTVNLAGCNLKGSLPFFTKPDSLTSIDLSDNHFIGGISGLFQKLSSLQNAKLSNNQLKGNLSEIKLPSGLALLDLHSNQLSGLLSGLLVSTGRFLETVDLSNNQIMGTIPSTISKLVELKKLDVSRNHITGTIPPSLGNLSKLEWLDISINSIGGKIPTNLLMIRQLRHVNFRANKLCGEIPQGRPLNIFPSAAYAHNFCLCGKPLPPCKQG
ncbi:hypothetical protein SSX86_027887 [Deinandra increscens subsp. villosa]|uniref:Leucine-rich repeat-containing N-terminal plant-type domain-containing protein n=1 Tax=Deinandra increscens subsp. villosa TaxID=3103831 RepID=A0AAP0CC31_9ASTR